MLEQAHNKVISVLHGGFLMVMVIFTYTSWEACVRSSRCDTDFAKTVRAVIKKNQVLELQMRD